MSFGIENIKSVVRPCGFNVITLIPNGASSCLNALLAPSTPYLAAVYATKPASSLTAPNVIKRPPVLRRRP